MAERCSWEGLQSHQQGIDRTVCPIRAIPIKVKNERRPCQSEME